MGLIRRLWSSVILSAIFLVWIALDFHYSLDVPLSVRASETLSLKKGEGILALSKALQKKGWLVDPVWLIVQGVSSGSARNLKYGDYLIVPGTTPRALLDLVVSGRSRQVPVRIIEGMQFRDLIEILSQHPIVRHQLDPHSSSDVMARLGEPDVYPEGYFFPDTYFTAPETSDLDVLRKAHSRMQKILEEEWGARASDLPLKSPYEGLILASIVEKETGQESERSAISGVFIRRLRLGMRLQTDPSVIYGLGAGFNGNLTKQDLLKDTPYNTYTRKGLPPTPIAFPGRAAIHAAFHPDQGSSLYFVARGDGGHVFSDSLEAHERAVDQYQRKKVR